MAEFVAKADLHDIREWVDKASFEMGELRQRNSILADENARLFREVQILRGVLADTVKGEAP